MLYHHSERDYAEAASAAASIAREKLYAQVEIGRTQAEAIASRVFTEVPDDAIVRSKALLFEGEGDPREGLRVGFDSVWDEHRVGVNKHSTNQLCSRGGIPIKYYNWLTDPSRESWGLPLAAKNMRDIYGNQDSRFLTRSYGGQLRGFLSDRYRRRDSRPLLEGFLDACKTVGALPYDGAGSETKVSMKAVLPRVFEPVPNEVFSMGVMWENSDYGNGKHQLLVFLSRLWCTNMAIMTSGFAQIHLGRKLSENPMVSQKTVELENTATVSAMHDVIGEAMSPESVEGICSVIRKANEERIDPDIYMKTLSKRLSKAEVASVTEKFNTPDVEQLPPGNTLWRMSNALSWFAKEQTDPERKIELSKLAGGILPKAA